MAMQLFRRKRTGHGRSRRGFTLAEIAISISIAALVMAAVASLQYLSGRSIKELYGQTRTRSSRMIALDQIRYRLMNGRIGSVSITQDGHRIEFDDPMKGGATSAFFFIEDTDTLFYDEDIDDATQAINIVRGPIDITFEIQDGGEMIGLKVKSQAYMAQGDVDLQDGETAVYLRNI